MWILNFVGANGETCFNTTTLISCVQNFPKSRGPFVGILKGFPGLSGAILTKLYTLVHSDHASLIFMVVVGAPVVTVSFMFIVRSVGGHRQICLLLASYFMGVMLVQDVVDLSETVITIFTVILLVILFIPLLSP